MTHVLTPASAYSPGRPVDAGRPLWIGPLLPENFNMNLHVMSDESTSAQSRESDGPSTFDRIGFASGIAAAVLSLVGAVLFIAAILPDLPAIDSPAPERAEFYAAMARSSVYRSISYLGELQMPLLLLFFGGLYGVLRRAERGSGALSISVFGAGVALAVIMPIIILIEDHLMLGFAVAGVDPVTVASIDGLGPLAFALGGFPQAVVLAGTSALLTRGRLIPRALGWSGGVLAVLSLVGTGTLMRGALFPVSSLTMLLSRVWLLALALVLLRRGGVTNHHVAAMPSGSEQLV